MLCLTRDRPSTVREGLGPTSAHPQRPIGGSGDGGAAVGRDVASTVFPWLGGCCMQGRSHRSQSAVSLPATVGTLPWELPAQPFVTASLQRAVCEGGDGVWDPFGAGL